MLVVAAITLSTVSNFFLGPVYQGVFISAAVNAGSDFINYWSAARLVLTGQVMTLFDADIYWEAQKLLFNVPTFHERHNWSYPPHFLPWITWLGFFSYPVAFVLWLVATFALYALSVVIGRAEPWKLVAVLGLAPASYQTVLHGQNGFLSAALLVGGLRAMETRPVLAGILLGCLSYKPQIGLLLPVALVAARQWKVLGVAALTVLVLMGFAVILFGFDPFFAYLTQVIPYQCSLLQIPFPNDEIYTKMMPSFFMAARIWGASLELAYQISVAMLLLSGGVVAYVFCRYVSPDIRQAVFLTAVFLASPYVFSYDMPILAAGIVAFVAVAGHRFKIPVLLMVLVVWVLPMFVFILGYYSLPIVPFVILFFLAVQLWMVRTIFLTQGHHV